MNPITIALLVIAIYSSSALADYKPSTSSEMVIETITVNANGSNTSYFEDITSIDTEKGVDNDSQQDISYNSKTETVKILEAYTLQADGRKIKVPKDGIRTTDDPISNGAPMFSETKHKVVIFPDVKVGSRLYLKYRSTEHTPRFKGQFHTARFFSPHYVVKNYQINLIVSNKLPVQVDTRGMDGGLVREANNQKFYRYTFVQDIALPPEDGQTSVVDYAPYFTASSFKDHLELGRAYQKGVESKTKVTPDIQALADNLTNGIADQKSQVDAMYQWVSKNIRYVAVYLGNGGVVPHTAQTILSNRYGDCKDHSVILETLLKAKGIESSPALINLGSAYTLPKLAVMTPQNHVINYIPSLDLYLDATAQLAPYGALPMDDMDKPVILTALNRIGHTPKMKAQDNLMATKVDITISNDGSMTGTSHSKMTGAVEVDFRGVQAGQADFEDEALAKYRLSSFGETGLGKITASDPYNLSKPFEESVTFSLDPTSNFPGPGAISVPVGLAEGSIARLGKNKPRDAIKFSTACYSNTMEETYTLTFPSSTRITRIPSDVNFKNASISYTATYHLVGNKVEVFRRYQAENETHVCDASSNDRKLAFFKVLQRDLKSQIFYD
jgi:transglutaminase-like putative cysteine protease